MVWPSTFIPASCAGETLVSESVLLDRKADSDWCTTITNPASWMELPLGRLWHTIKLVDFIHSTFKSPTLGIFYPLSVVHLDPQPLVEFIHITFKSSTLGRIYLWNIFILKPWYIWILNPWYILSVVHLVSLHYPELSNMSPWTKYCSLYTLAGG